MKMLLTGKQMPIRPLMIASVALSALAFIGQTTWKTWDDRDRPNFHPTRHQNWRMISAGDRRQTHIRVEGSAFWLPVKTQTLSSNAHILTEGASTVLRNIQSDSSIAISANAVAHIKNQDESTFTLLSGVANVRGPVFVVLSEGRRHIAVGETKTVSVVTSAASVETAIVDTLTPTVGSNIELAKTPAIEFTWAQAGSEHSLIEFARDPSFQTVLFSQEVGSRTSTRTGFGDRGHGAWFARIRDRDKTVAVTSFHTFEKLAPDRLRRLGRRWVAWEDRGPSSFYRVELSATTNFSTISQSVLTRSKFFDLSLSAQSGIQYLRVVGIDQNEREHFGESIPVDIPDREQLLKARMEFGDPSLALLARGWRIQLNEAEAKRIREGYVILRENELRGIRVSDELDQKIKREPAKYIFEVARDLAFSNPERVRPTSRGELLPPALPLGAIYARIRELEDDGLTLGAFGPASKISTLLPAPKPLPVLFSGESAVLKWKFPFEVSGFEIQIRSVEAESNGTTSHRTHAREKELILPSGDSFEWTVTALDESGRPISVTSQAQTDSKPKLIRKVVARDSTLQDQRKARQEALRELASINPSLVQLDLPVDDAVIVGGATATKYGRLQWRDLQPDDNTKTDAFTLEIATDGDFVNIIERASTSRLNYTLQGDLPEGALFWRVKKRKLNIWSTSRKFEIVYE